MISCMTYDPDRPTCHSSHVPAPELHPVFSDSIIQTVSGNEKSLDSNTTQMGHRRRRQKPIFIIAAASWLFFLFAGFGLAEENASDSSSTPINHDLYHTSGALLEEIEGLVHRHPDKLSVETVSSMNKGYQAQMSVVTYCREKKDCDGKAKLRILLSFGQHGRELITSELALRILSILSEEGFLPNTDRNSLNRTLDKLVIKIVPVENMNGRKLVEGGEFCERRNGRAVDLNRNWSVDWGKKEKDYDPYEENPGTGPFSEPESQFMRKLAMSFEPHIWVNVHSGMEALFMPYDHKNTTPSGAPSEKMRSILQKMNRLHLGDRCLIGSGGGSVGYLAHGTATDYMYDVARIPMAFTFEIYGDPAASSKDCFRMFNPMDITTFNKVLNDWSAAFFEMFESGASQLDGLHSGTISSSFDKLISIDDYLNGYLMERRNRYGKKMEVIELGMQEIRTYFRLFMLSSILLLFMFCSRISKSARPIVSAISL